MEKSWISIFPYIIRLVGLFIMLFGLWIGYQVIQEGWRLYEKPERIVHFSNKVEEGCQLDQFSHTLCQFLHKLLSEWNEHMHEYMQRIQGKNIPKKELPSISPVRFSYFAAWGIVFLLLLVISKIAFWAITTGVKIFLFEDISPVALAKAIVKEVMAEMGKTV